MYITFHGAARQVTGSKHLIHLNDGTSILLDCGLFQGMQNADDLNGHFGFNPAKVDYLILSHAHIDHCGLIPRLVAEGFNGPIFCTPATMNLARILLADSARIQEQDVEYSNKHRKRNGQQLLELLYNEEQAIASIRQFKIVDYNEEHEIKPGVKFSFSDAGHLVGSASVHLW